MMNIRKNRAFTLIEITIVLVVVGLILGGVLKTVGFQRQQLKRDETRQLLENINQALIGFAATTGRLPCPDTDADGIGNPANPVAGSSCTSNEGFLPFADIGSGSQDAWGNRFRYRVAGTADAVTESFADSAPSQLVPPLPTLPAQNASFTMIDDGDIVIVDRNAAIIANRIPAIVISYGENGGRTIANGFPCAAGVPSAVEDENCNDDITFISDDYSNVAGQEYDDLVMWVSLTVLKARMLEARLLP